MQAQGKKQMLPTCTYEFSVYHHMILYNLLLDFLRVFL